MDRSNKREKRFLFLTIFISGMCTLGIEFTTSRLLQTVYGTSNLVWANVIGMVLLFLTLGYFWGGRLADRRPNYKTFYTLVVTAGITAIIFLLLTSFLLQWAAAGLAALNIGALAGSLLGVIFSLAVPITLMGAISPFAIRLGIDDVAESGRISGQIYAISTLGSLAGTYLPVLWLIPTAGSRLTALIFGGILTLFGLWGMWRLGQSRQALVGLLIFAVLLPLSIANSQSRIKTTADAIYETESAYNYIQVIEREGCTYLMLNEGQAFHSFVCEEGAVPYVSVWSGMLAAPYFKHQLSTPQRLAVIGLAGGSIPQQYLRIFPDAQVDGIEIDPEIIEVGKTYFALDDPRIQSIAADGRYGLNQLEERYDVITIDAYRVPYIPWHLTTEEFFTEVERKLTPDGVVAMNVGRVPNDRRLIDAMTTTLLTVFPHVYATDIPGTLNTLLFATHAESSFDQLETHLQQLPADTDPLLRETLKTVAANRQPLTPSEVIFTDNRAPVETIVDSLVIRYLSRTGLRGMPTVNE